MGRLRTENGRRIPWKVKFWAVGNEMYGDWQLGHMPLDQYVQKPIQIVDAMRFKDPNIQLIGVGAVGEWSRTMLEQCSNHMEMISEHLYWQDQDSLIKHVEQISEGIRRVANAHRQYRRDLSNLQSKDIPIALDEWNYWYGPNEFGELGVRYFLQDALGIAAGLHEMFRNSDLFYMANYAQTVNVIGAIKTTPTQAEFETTGLVLKLYRHRFGTKPVKVSPSASVKNCDISAALTDDGSVLTIGIVNPNQETLLFDLDLVGAELTGSGRKFEISGDNRFSHNDPETDRKVDIVQQGLSSTSDGLKVAPISVTLFHLDLIP
jgi:alpha-N-arabinofuranosidase